MTIEERLDQAHAENVICFDDNANRLLTKRLVAIMIAGFKCMHNQYTPTTLILHKWGLADVIAWSNPFEPIKLDTSLDKMQIYGLNVEWQDLHEIAVPYFEQVLGGHLPLGTSTLALCCSETKTVLGAY